MGKYKTLCNLSHFKNKHFYTKTGIENSLLDLHFFIEINVLYESYLVVTQRR